jgi:hypothetical protein
MWKDRAPTPSTVRIATVADPAADKAMALPASRRSLEQIGRALYAEVRREEAEREADDKARAQQTYGVDPTETALEGVLAVAHVVVNAGLDAVGSALSE